MDPTAFEDLYRRSYAGLVAFAREYVGDFSAAEDVVQDVFLAVWRRRNELELRSSIRTYLYSAVRNAALDRLKHADGVRRHGMKAATALTPPAQPADSALRQRELASAVEAALQQLPQRAREVFIMSRDGGLSYAEIAGVLGVSVKAVEASMSRALRALRRKLAPFLEGDLVAPR
jgi:RNA polymerase sigma-70 factor, ECF subfamily